MSNIPSERKAEQWRDHFLDQADHVIKEVLDHPRKEGAERLGAGMAQQVRQDLKDAREEERHRESMTEARRAMSWGRCGVYLGIGALLLTCLIELVRYLQ